MEPVFGKYFAHLRRTRLGLSLRRFAEENGYDPGNLSKLERGKLPPPQRRDKLQGYAIALGLDEGTDEWIEFFDRAAAARGDIPPDLLEDDDVVERLPILFRTLRADPPSDEDLAKVIEIVRRS